METRDWFRSILENKSLAEKLKKIKLIITDVDGCLTNGTAAYSDNHEIQKSFCIQDGFMIAKCNKPNMPHIAFVTGRSDAAATRRAKVLGIPDNLYYKGVSKNKAATVEKIQTQLKITKEETLFFGDDILDLQAKDAVGIFASPSNSLFYVKSESDIISPREGGNGALRAILDLILYLQEKHLAQDSIRKALKL
jgi:YrbI family 3-deoxy-D-manno-octulosonate 8-phosphate phosphatase